MGSLCALNSGCSTSEAPQDRERPILLAAPTTLQDAGLLDALVRAFERESGFTVKTLAVGTGEALAMARRGDADVVLGHAPDLERRSVAEGFVRNRREVMINDFLLVGPNSDPAGIAGTSEVTDALAAIARSQSRFVSRADDSGTHRFEERIWSETGVQPSGSWYVESGQGMGATLQIANQLDAYTLVDRGTYLAFRERLALRPAVTGDPRQRNVYSVLEVDPERFARIHEEGARAFSDFLLDPTTQLMIGAFGRERFGEPLYRPAMEAAHPPPEPPAIEEP